MKTILVTGAVRNTGLAIARRFAADGWGVALTSRDAAAAEETAKALEAEFPQCRALGIGMDPAKVPDIRAAFAAVKERFGRLDAFVNNAANLGVGLSVLNATEADWDAVFIPVANAFDKARDGTFQKSGKSPLAEVYSKLSPGSVQAPPGMSGSFDVGTREALKH